MMRYCNFVIIIVIIIGAGIWLYVDSTQLNEFDVRDCTQLINPANISNLTRVAELPINPSIVNFDADNILTIVTGNENVYFLHFGTETIRLQRVHHLDHGFAQTQISPNESYFVVTSFDAEDYGDADSRVEIWEMPELDRLHEIRNSALIFNPVFNSDESLLAYQLGFPPSDIIVIRLDTFEVVTSFRGSYPIFDPLNPDNIAYITNEGVELRSIAQDIVIGQ